MATQLTVLMAVHNGQPYLRTAVDSILSQTYRGFEFLIVDDASTDDTVDVLRSYDDERINLLCLDQNIGQTAALNRGVEQASTPWIARMDADDFSAPTRLEKQMAALDSDSSLGCVGTFVWTFREDPNKTEREIRLPETSSDINRALLARWPLVHSTIVINRVVLTKIGAYNERFRYCADIDLYDRLLDKHTAANVPEFLLGLRQHGDQGSRSRTAVEENIEISTRRLSSRKYSRAEEAIVRGNLAHLLIFRARYFGGDQRFLMLFKDLWSALRSSPAKFPWYTFKIFVFYSLGERNRSKIRWALERLLPGFRTR